MKITADQVAATETALLIGLRVEFARNGPVRFHTVRVPWEAMSTETRRTMIAAFNRTIEITADDVPLF